MRNTSYLFVLLFFLGCSSGQSIDTEFEGGTAQSEFDGDRFQAEAQVAFEVGFASFWMELETEVDASVPMASIRYGVLISAFSYISIGLELDCGFDPAPACQVCAWLDKPATPSVCLHFRKGIEFEVQTKPTAVGTSESGLD